MRSTRRRLVSIISIVAVLSGCSPKTANFGEMSIDPDTLTVSFSDYLWSDSPVTPHYFRFRQSDGRLSVTHLAGPTEKRESYNFFFVGADGRLVYREKRQLLQNGPFGNIYTTITYFYAAEYNGQPASVETALYNNDAPHETPRILPSLPPGADRLDAISLARVFKGGPQYLVASANYAPDGQLESLSVNGSKDGNWIQTSPNPPADRFGAGTMIGDRPEIRMRFGLPPSFPVNAYKDRPGPVFSPTQYAVVLDAVYFHFNRSRWVRQDVISPAGTVDSKFLQFQYTREDNILDRADSIHKFGRLGRGR